MSSGLLSCGDAPRVGSVVVCLQCARVAPSLRLLWLWEAVSVVRGSLRACCGFSVFSGAPRWGGARFALVRCGGCPVLFVVPVAVAQGVGFAPWLLRLCRLWLCCRCGRCWGLCPSLGLVSGDGPCCWSVVLARVLGRGFGPGVGPWCWLWFWALVLGPGVGLWGWPWCWAVVLALVLGPGVWPWCWALVLVSVPSSVSWR